MKHQFILEPYHGKKSRFDCPSCGEIGEFSRYIESETGQYVHHSVGKCNRQSKCAYHYPPRQYFADHPDQSVTSVCEAQPIVQPKREGNSQPSYMDPRLLELSKTSYHNNNFVKWLQSRFGIEVAASLADRYLIGTSKRWSGATVFWQVDVDQSIRAGKIMHYDAHTGKRTKEPDNLISWVHSALKLK